MTDVKIEGSNWSAQWASNCGDNGAINGIITDPNGLHGTTTPFNCTWMLARKGPIATLDGEWDVHTSDDKYYRLNVAGQSGAFAGVGKKWSSIQGKIYDIKIEGSNWSAQWASNCGDNGAINGIITDPNALHGTTTPFDCKWMLSRKGGIPPSLLTSDDAVPVSISTPVSTQVAPGITLEVMSVHNLQPGRLPDSLRTLSLTAHTNDEAGNSLAHVGMNFQGQWFKALITDPNLCNSISRHAFDLVWEAGTNALPVLRTKGTGALIVDKQFVHKDQSYPLQLNSEIMFMEQGEYNQVLQGPSYTIVLTLQLRTPTKV
jgi:hypothetical protein